MNIRNILKTAGLIAVIALGLSTVSCQEKIGTEDQTEYTIETFRKEFSFNFRAGALKSKVTTNAPMWMVQANYSWIHADVIESESDGKILEISVDENDSGSQRKGSFDVIAMDDSGNELARTSMQVTQNPKAGVVDGAIMFEDKLFEEIMLSSFDKDGDQTLSVEEAEAIVNLDLENLGINSIEGVRYFKNLESLDVNENNLKRIDISGLKKLKNIHFNMNKVSSFKCGDCPALQTIMGRSNKLKEVDLSGLKASLEVLDLMQNELVRLDLSGMSVLQYAVFGKNAITSLKVAGCGKLWNLACNDNNISELDLNGLSELLLLDCGNNFLRSLTLDSCTKLGQLTINGNSRIESLDLTGCPIVHLKASDTGISSLQFSKPEDVQTLRISNTSIKKLDLLPYKQLKTLECSGLLLEKLDVKANTMLETLICNKSGLTSLDLTGKAQLIHVELRDNALGTLDLGDSAKLEELNVRGNRELQLTLPKSLENSNTFKLENDGDCKVNYR